MIDNLAYDFGGTRVEKHPRMLGDVNGDGRSDIVAFGDKHTFVALVGSGYQLQSTRSATSMAPGFCYEKSVSHPGLPRDHHYWHVYLDSYNDVGESSEGNNVNYYSFLIDGAPPRTNRETNQWSDVRLSH